MNINNLNTYQKPAFSLAEMCLNNIANREYLKLDPIIEVTKKNENSRFKARNGIGLGTKGVSKIEGVGQTKIRQFFDDAKNDYNKAYKLIDAYKASKVK